MGAARLSVPVNFIQEAEFNKSAGHAKAKNLLRIKNRPTAIFAANDLIAFGVLAAVREAGLRCPKDVSVVGFDNLDDSDATVPALTTVDQFAYQIGATAAQTVVERMRGQGGTTRHTLLAPELRIKESTAPSPRANTSKPPVTSKRH
jgi:LacI family transcriptional regulator